MMPTATFNITSMLLLLSDRRATRFSLFCSRPVQLLLALCSLCTITSDALNWLAVPDFDCRENPNFDHLVYVNKHGAVATKLSTFWESIVQEAVNDQREKEERQKQDGVGGEADKGSASQTREASSD
ncbi:unnamed protein product, partial [Amoebophrya sp. A25]|eukprot:GSA25T00003511001.1